MKKFRDPRKFAITWPWWFDWRAFLFGLSLWLAIAPQEGAPREPAAAAIASGEYRKGEG